MSGSTIGGVLGAAVGYYVGGARGAQVGWMIGSAVGGYVDPDVIPGQRLQDAQTQTAAEGAPRPIVYGTVVVAGNVIQAGPLDEHENKDRVGKGGSQVQQSFSYTRTYAIRVCEGPIGNISRIWRDDKLVYDVRDPAAWPEQADAIRAMAGDTAKFATGITIYKGDETQLPDASLEALPTANGGGVGEVCAYRGTCYVVFTDDDLTDRQGSLPNYRFEVSVCGDSTTTTAVVPWVHGNTGSIQSIFDVGIYKTTALTAGWNDNLRRTTDGGRTWDAVDYMTPTGWGPSDYPEAVWHVNEPIGSEVGTWYLATRDKIAVSYNAGALFTNYMTPVHEINGAIGGGGGVWLAAGQYWAGAYNQTNTTIFQPLSLGATEVDLGADYGEVSAIGDVLGNIIVGTASGNIITADNVLRYTDATSRPITQFAYGNGITLAALATGGYLWSDDAGSTWTYYSEAGSTPGVVWARGAFYRVTHQYIHTSTDGINWTQVDDAFFTAAQGEFIRTDGFSILATSQSGVTAALPSAYLLPDMSSGWHIDDQGNVVGDENTAVDRCVANLADIVTDLCERVGITADQLDVTELTDDVRGFVVGQQMAAADALRSLQQYYFFDLPEWGDYTDTGTKLCAVKRGGAVSFAITDDDLVESDDDEDTRAQAVEFPRKLNLLTSDVDSDYNPTKQTAERRTENVKAVGETSFTLPVVTIRTEAAPKADIMLKVAWEEALGRTEFILPEEFSALTPSDCFTKDSKRWRAEKCEYGDGTVKVEAVRDRASAYTSTATPGAAPPPITPPSTLRGPTVFAAMNLPSLRTADNVPGMYIAVCGVLDGWIGCDLQLSVDEGASYQSVATIRNEATMGELTASCGTSGTITAKVLHGHELDSVTTAQIAARANAWAITSNGTSEVGQSQTATETAIDGTYDLTDNTRGQLGTTAATHLTGDRFVMLDSVTFLELDVSLAGRTLWFRPVSIGTAAANNAVYQVVFSPIFTNAPVIDFFFTEVGDPLTAENGSYYELETA